jgi:hypothetical protein
MKEGIQDCAPRQNTKSLCVGILKKKRRASEL